MNGIFRVAMWLVSPGKKTKVPNGEDATLKAFVLKKAEEQERKLRMIASEYDIPIEPLINAQVEKIKNEVEQRVIQHQAHPLAQTLFSH